MNPTGNAGDASVGFLTVVQVSGAGAVGGLLVLNSRGRPLEFHCTAPVVTNRAQEILYGQTLRPYLFGEQIGATLLQKCRSQPQVVATDSKDALAARWTVSLPMAWVPYDTKDRGIHTPDQPELMVG
ncbi:MAG TPA: hypothetical protein VIY86_04695, partial [Pirellulaceae bacterium]